MCGVQHGAARGEGALAGGAAEAHGLDGGRVVGQEGVGFALTVVDPEHAAEIGVGAGLDDGAGGLVAAIEADEEVGVGHAVHEAGRGAEAARAAEHDRAGGGAVDEDVGDGGEREDKVVAALDLHAVGGGDGRVGMAGRNGEGAAGAPFVEHVVVGLAQRDAGAAPVGDGGDVETVVAGVAKGAAGVLVPGRVAMLLRAFAWSRMPLPPAPSSAPVIQRSLCWCR